MQQKPTHSGGVRIGIIRFRRSSSCDTSFGGTSPCNSEHGDIQEYQDDKKQENEAGGGDNDRIAVSRNPKALGILPANQGPEPVVMTSASCHQASDIGQLGH